MPWIFFANLPLNIKFFGEYAFGNLFLMFKVQIGTILPYFHNVKAYLCSFYNEFFKHVFCYHILRSGSIPYIFTTSTNGASTSRFSLSRPSNLSMIYVLPSFLGFFASILFLAYSSSKSQYVYAEPSSILNFCPILEVLINVNSMSIEYII